MKRVTAILLCLAALSLESRAQVVEWEQDNLAAGEVDNIVITNAGALFAVTGAGSTITKDVQPGALAVERSTQKQVPGYAARRARRSRHEDGE